MEDPPISDYSPERLPTVTLFESLPSPSWSGLAHHCINIEIQMLPNDLTSEESA